MLGVKAPEHLDFQSLCSENGLILFSCSEIKPGEKEWSTKVVSESLASRIIECDNIAMFNFLLRWSLGSSLSPTSSCIIRSIVQSSAAITCGSSILDVGWVARVQQAGQQVGKGLLDVSSISIRKRCSSFCVLLWHGFFHLFLHFSAFISFYCFFYP